MSQADIIVEIGKKKQQRNQAIFAANAALRALIDEGLKARTKPIEDINTAGLMAHLVQLTEKQEEIGRLTAEIKELEY